MKNELEEILKSPPLEVPWKEIIEFENFDERLSAVSVLFINTIGVCKDYIEFCPDNNPPLKEEILSWIWSYRPDLAEELLKIELSEDFKKLVIDYKNNDMQKFWDYIS